MIQRYGLIAKIMISVFIGIILFGLFLGAKDIEITQVKKKTILDHHVLKADQELNSNLNGERNGVYK